jgi:hypothetical protein
MQIKNAILALGLVCCTGTGWAIFSKFTTTAPPRHRPGVDAALRLRLGDLYFDSGWNMVPKRALLKYIDSPLIVINGGRQDTVAYYEVCIAPKHADYIPSTPGRGRSLNPFIKHTIYNNDTATFFFANVFVKTATDSLCHRAYGFSIRMQ